VKLSVIVPILTGDVPKSLREQVAGHPDVEIVSVTGVCPVGRARNEGLRRATGAYIAWVDGDDEVSPDWFASILAALDGMPDVVIFDAKNEGWPCMDDFIYGKPNTDDVVRDVYENECLQGHLWRTVSRRELWDGLAFDETICALEDFLLLPRLLLRASSVVYLPKLLYRYVYHSDSTIASVNVRRIEESVRMAIRRWREAPAVFASAALLGSVRLVYDALLFLNVDVRYRQLPEAKAAGREGERFLRQHWHDVRLGGHWRTRLLCAGLGFWLPQRLAHWRHFG